MGTTQTKHQLQETLVDLCWSVTDRIQKQGYAGLNNKTNQDVSYFQVPVY